MKALHFIFDGENPNARFVEVETPDGKSVSVGQWRKRDDGYSELVITAADLYPASPTPEREP